MELLPEDITIDILSRLHADSVLQCKCVCRAWEALIEESAFHNKWMHRFDPVAAATASNNNRILATIECVSSPVEELDVDIDGYYKREVLEFGVYTSSDEVGGMGCLQHWNAPAKHHPPCNFKGSGYSWTIVGSCNGLICLTTAGSSKRKAFNCKKYNMYVGNPLTGVYAKLPLIIQKTESRCRSVGFGYCPITKEYKAVVIYDWNVEVYTLGSGRWRNKRTKFLESWSSPDQCDKPWSSQDCSIPGVLVNGALYFYHGVDGDIVSFDLTKEEFRIVQSPPHHHPRDQTMRVFELFKLGVLGGSLCLFRFCHHLPNTAANFNEVWVMDNEHESWTKKFSKQFDNLNEEMSMDDDNRPDCFYSQYEFIFSYVKSFVSVKDLGEKDIISMSKSM